VKPILLCVFILFKETAPGMMETSICSSSYALRQKGKAYAVTLAFEKIKSVVLHFISEFEFVKKSKPDEPLEEKRKSCRPAGPDGCLYADMTLRLEHPVNLLKRGVGPIKQVQSSTAIDASERRIRKGQFKSASPYQSDIAQPGGVNQSKRAPEHGPGHIEANNQAFAMTGEWSRKHARSACKIQYWTVGFSLP
jgi:hypothetical protein